MTLIIQFFRNRKVHEKVDVAESWKVAGAGPIGVRWVDINKGDNINPKSRIRPVATESNTACHAGHYVFWGYRIKRFSGVPKEDAVREL